MPEHWTPNTGTAFRTAISNKLFSGWVPVVVVVDLVFYFHSYGFLMRMIYSFLPNQNIRSFIYVSTNTFKLWYAMFVFSCKTLFSFIWLFFPQSAVDFLFCSLIIRCALALSLFEFSWFFFCFNFLIQRQTKKWQICTKDEAYYILIPKWKDFRSWSGAEGNFFPPQNVCRKFVSVVVFSSLSSSRWLLEK